MATTASITLTSDIIPNFGGYSKEMTLTEAGTLTDIKETTGYARRQLSAASKVDLVTMANLIIGEDTANLSHKIFVKNIGYRGTIDKTTGVKVYINSVEIGRLYGGDWLFIPWTADSNEDIIITPSVATEMTIEYIVFS